MNRTTEENTSLKEIPNMDKASRTWNAPKLRSMNLCNKTEGKPCLYPFETGKYDTIPTS
jgi:hypothetical protein